MSLDELVDQTCLEYQVKREDVFSRRRFVEAVDARCKIAFHLYWEQGWNVARIGRYFGHSNHTRLGKGFMRFNLAN